MKPLILSFFAVILGVSVFVDKDENTNSPDLPKTVQTKATDVTHNAADSIPLFANKSIKAD